MRQFEVRSVPEVEIEVLGKCSKIEGKKEYGKRLSQWGVDKEVRGY